MSRAEALACLGVKPQSLYAYVSRGRVRAKPHPDDPRASLYSADDLARLVARRRSSRSRAAVAEGTLSWGEPVLVTGLTSVEGGRLRYAGVDAVELSEHAGLEEVARLLWSDPDGLADGPRSRPREHENPKARMLTYLATEAAAGEAASVDTAEAWRLLQGFADAACGTRGRGAIHDRLAAHWRVPQAADAIRRALVLIADHDLNPSTFAARVAAGTGASLAACALAGLATLTGPRHGEASAGAVRYLRAAIQAAQGGQSLDEPLAEWTAAGNPGVGHPLYSGGDPRAQALLACLPSGEAVGGMITDAINAAAPPGSLAPNIDMALAALTVRYGLRDTAPFKLFAVGRMVGWIAHAFEQHRSGQPIRPRARYEAP